MNPTSTKLLRTPGMSLHRQLYMALRVNILNRTWPAGSALPTEDSLSAQFNVSRITVRRALTDLAADGLVVRRHGVGTFVNGGIDLPRPNATLTMLDELRRAAGETDVRVLDVAHQPAPPAIARMLQLPDDDSAFHAVRLRILDRIPVMITDAWVPERFGAKITAAALKKHPLYELLLAHGMVFGRVIQEVNAEAASPQLAQQLDTEVGSPLLRVSRLLHDPQDRPVEYITVHVVPERTRLLMDVPGQAMNTLSAGQFVHDGVSHTQARRHKKHASK